MTCDLKGKKGLIAGIANAESIAYGCARAAHAAGAELLVAYGHPKAEPHVQPLLAEIGNPPAMLCDVTDEAQMQALFEHARERWGKLDFLVHSIAFAPKEDLQGRLIDCSSAGFHTAMEISCFSFIRMAKLAEPLMQDGGCLLTMSYYGAERVVEHYNLMGPVKAALESAVRYLAAELGPQGIRVHALSPGPLLTRALSGIAQFDTLLERAAERSPQRRLVSIDDVGATAAFLASDAASALTGLTLYVDAGYQIMG
jgi:enoyl-[acyl-carrier protein] reductase I